MDSSQTLDTFGWVGATIEGKYRVDAVVGEGGFGIVYRGHHLGFEERVAIKCLRMPETLIGQDRDRFFASFLSEGRLLHRLSRSTAGIVQALDVGGAVSPKGIWTPYLVLEWLEGRTLDEELDEHAAKGLGGRTLAAAIELLEPAARALAIAHEQGIAHRDVKPANLFVAEVGGKRTLKVLDFGIAKVITETASLTRAFEATGSSLQAFTARYGAPEQFSRRFGATGPWTDVFALALVFVEIVTGRSALDGEDAAQLFVASSDQVHRPTLRSVGVPTSDGLEAVLKMALAVDPKERYLNAGDFWDALVAAATADGLIEPQARRRAASIVNITGSLPDLDATAIEAASIRRAEGNAATQLATTSAVPSGRKQRVPTAFRPTPLRVSAAAGAAALAFATVAGLGHLVWSPGKQELPLASALPSRIEVPPLPSKLPASSPSSRKPSRVVAVPPPGVIPAQSSASPPGSAPAVAPPAPNEALLRSAREVPEGRIAGKNMWFAQFRMLRREGDLGKPFVEAQSRCAEIGMSLCSEAQWTRACEVHPGLGSTTSWTASAEASGFVVRGGFGCADRAIAKGSDVLPERGGVCCDRTVGIDTKNTNRSFLRATSERLLEIERTLNQRNADGFLAFVAEPLTLDGAPRTRTEAQKLLTDSFNQWPDHWIINDECAVSISTPVVVIKRTRRHRAKRVEGPTSWSADCEQTRHRAGDIAVVTTSYVFTGTGKLKSVADSRVVRDWSKP